MSITAFPKHVQAFSIYAINALDAKTNARTLTLSNGSTVLASVAHLNARAPVVGDYWVVPSEGDPYIAPKSTFAVTYG